MVGRGSAGEPSRADGLPGDISARERRGLERCRRALERGRRVHGRIVASDERLGLLLDLRGAVGHVPPEDAAAPAARGSVLRPGERDWEGWVVAVAGDVVHLGARRPGGAGDDGPVRDAEVLSTGRSGAVVRLDDGLLGVVPWEELSWEPCLARPELPRGTRLAGRVVGLTLDGPVLSPRAIAPTPWPAIALALAPDEVVAARVEARSGDLALLRTARAPRAAAVVPAAELPEGSEVGAVLEARVARISAPAGTLELADLRPSARAPRPSPEARRPGPRGPEQAASGSRS